MAIRKAALIEQDGVIAELCDLHCEAPVGSSAIVSRNHDNHASLALGWGKFLLCVHGHGGPKNDEAENCSDDPG
jgi:hypothetical protein